jgi:hypothetical protein
VYAPSGRNGDKSSTNADTDTKRNTLLAKIEQVTDEQCINETSRAKYRLTEELCSRAGQVIQNQHHVTDNDGNVLLSSCLAKPIDCVMNIMANLWNQLKKINKSM